MLSVKGIKIYDLCLVDLPRSSWRSDKFKIKVEFANDTKSSAKNKAKKGDVDGDCVVWNESFHFPGDIMEDSQVTFTVVRKRARVFSETIGSVQKNVVDLIHSGSYKLEISKDCQLTFNIEKMSNILPIVIDGASKSTAQTPTPGTSSKAVENQDVWSLFLSQFLIFMNAIDAASALNPYAKLAWSILSLIPKTILSQQGRNKGIRKLCEKLKEVYDYITDAERLHELKDTQQKTLLLLVRQTIECAYFIREYGTRSIAGKVLRGGTIDDQIKSFNGNLDHYLSVLTGSITLETGIVTLRIAATTAETKDLILLDGMQYAKDAGFISGKRCLPGTRQHLINRIVEWVNSDAPQQILVLSGQAGTGKSAVAHTIAELFKTQNRLGSMFCFNRSYKDRRNLLFSTISRGLADTDVLWRESLVKIIQDNAIRTSMDPVTQFNELVAAPSKNVATVGPVVIVIDALDESGDRGERATILELLFRRCSELPVNYRVIITCRPEQDIELLRADSDNIQCIRMGDIATDETLSDIQSYVLDRLKSIVPTLNEIEENWSQILAKRAEGLFQWADTACRFIDPNVRYLPIVQKRWMTCVSSSSSSLYKLYEGIISSQRESENSQFVDNLKTIVSAIIMAREPLSLNALQNIFQGVIEDVRCILSPFGSLFRGVSDLSTPVQPLHTSLLDFFSDRNTKYHIDGSVQGTLTLGCLKVMNRMLRFNICDLETSHLSNRDVPNFSERVTTAIPSHLHYACYYWALHLHSSYSTDEIVREIRALMEKNLLFWFEVLSLLDEIEQGCSAMSILRDWSQNAGSDLATLATQASDAFHFGLTYREAMTGSTPHLYLSALPFAPRSSFISEQYLRQYPRLFSFDIDPFIHFTPTEIGVTKRHASSAQITRLAFSPCDRHIASGFDSGEICLLDYTTGEQINQWKPNTKSGRISDIVFSPDGELIYGCFPNVRRILIWNINTNEVKQESYDSVIEKSFGISTISSDGQYIAFESSHEVLLYDRAGSSIIGRFNRNRAKKTRYQFSSNGNLFAFVGERGVPAKICRNAQETAPANLMWGVGRNTQETAPAMFSERANTQVRDRSALVKLMKRVGGEVNLWNTQERVLVKSWGSSDSLALSDSYIAVLHFDGVMEVWDLTAMELVHSLTNRNPMEHEFIHIQFSAHNQYLLSSCRNTYRIWALSTGELIHQSHANGTIRDLALSPDLKYIALANSFDAGRTYIQQWTPRIVQQSSSDDLNDERLFVRNLWLHGTYLVLVLRHGLLQIWDITTTNTIVFEVMIGRHSAAMVFSVEDVVYVAYGVQSEEKDLTHGFTYRYELRLWDESGGQRILDESKGTVTALAFSASNNYLIVGVDRVGRGTLKILDIHERRLVVEPCSVEGTLKTLAFSSSGTSVLVGYIKNFSDACFEIRKCQSGLQVSIGPFRCFTRSRLPLGVNQDYICSIVFSANERYIVCTSLEGVEIFDVGPMEKRVRWIQYKPASIFGCRLSPDRKYFAWVEDNKLKIWDIDNNRLLLEDSSEVYYDAVCFSNGSAQLVTFVMATEHSPISGPVCDTIWARTCYNIWDMQTRKSILRYPGFMAHPCVLALHHGYLVLGPGPHCTVQSLRVLSAALHGRYPGTTFGTFPVDSSKLAHDTGIPVTDTDSEVLDYWLTARAKALFSSVSRMDKNGWVLGPQKELLFWVPKERREGLWYPGMIHLTVKNITKLNFDNFVHGTRWIECRREL